MMLEADNAVTCEAVEMSDEQKFLFDVKGWLLLKGVLSPAECEAIRQHLYAGGDTFSGPAQELLDHPAVTGILNEILSDSKPNNAYWNFRCENSFPTLRKNGWQPGSTSRPHVVKPPQSTGPMNFSCHNGRMYSGLTRVVWELNPVERGDGGTLFLSGTHKSNFQFPPSILQDDNDNLESYSCPEGSVFIFSESLLHASTAWKSSKHDRVSVFNAYNSVWAQWHKLNLDPKKIAAMPKKRQSLFRGVYAIDFDAKPKPVGNCEYGPGNQAL
jgi:hypothetical protein